MSPPLNRTLQPYTEIFVKILVGAVIVVMLASVGTESIRAQEPTEFGKIAVDTQNFYVSRGAAATDHTEFQEIETPMVVQSRGGATITITATVSGGPVEFRLNGPRGQVLAPGEVVFVPDGDGETHSATFVHRGGDKPSCRFYFLFWRSPTGAEVTLSSRTAVVTYRFAKRHQDGRLLQCAG